MGKIKTISVKWVTANAEFDYAPMTPHERKQYIEEKLYGQLVAYLQMNENDLPIERVVTERKDIGAREYSLRTCLVEEQYLQNLLNIKNKLELLRDIVWGHDIPSPTCPEYIEHHESIQDILKFIDNELLKEDK